MSITKRPGAKRQKINNFSARALTKASTVPAPVRKRVELKRVYDELDTPVSVSTTGSVFPLPLVAGGTNGNQRDGRVISLRAWELRGICQGADTSGGSLIRIIVFRWKQSNGGDPTVNDILYSVGSYPINRSYNLFHSSSYDILQDKVYNTGVHTVEVGSTTQYEPYQQYVHLYGKCNFTQTYQSDVATQVIDQQIYVLAISDKEDNILVANGAVTYIDI